MFDIHFDGFHAFQLLGSLNNFYIVINNSFQEVHYVGLWPFFILFFNNLFPQIMEVNIIGFKLDSSFIILVLVSATVSLLIIYFLWADFSVIPIWESLINIKYCVISLWVL